MGLINRAKCIYLLLYSSTLSLFNEEVSRLRKMFINNCYPSRFFDFTVDRVLNPRTFSTSDTDSVNSRYAILRVPYYGKESIKFAKQLSSIISKKFDIDIKIVYSTFKIKKKLFPSEVSYSLSSFIKCCLQI